MLFTPTFFKIGTPARKKTMVEDFENYEVGTKWERFTAGGFASAQVSLELYGEDFNMSKDGEEWWNLSTDASPGYNRWTTYPFFDGKRP